MVGLTTRATTDTNQLNIYIPDELKGVELQIIIIPAEKNSTQQIDFFTDEELRQLSTINPSTFTNDDEDYTKW